MSSIFLSGGAGYFYQDVRNFTDDRRIVSTSNGYIFVATAFGIFKSTNGGYSFSLLCGCGGNVSIASTGNRVCVVYSNYVDSTTVSQKGYDVYFAAFDATDTTVSFTLIETQRGLFDSSGGGVGDTAIAISYNAASNDYNYYLSFMVVDWPGPYKWIIMLSKEVGSSTWARWSTDTYDDRDNLGDIQIKMVNNYPIMFYYRTGDYSTSWFSVNIKQKSSRGITNDGWSGSWSMSMSPIANGNTTYVITSKSNAWCLNVATDGASLSWQTLSNIGMNPGMTYERAWCKLIYEGSQLYFYYRSNNAVYKCPLVNNAFTGANCVFVDNIDESKGANLFIYNGIRCYYGIYSKVTSQTQQYDDEGNPNGYTYTYDYYFVFTNPSLPNTTSFVKIAGAYKNSDVFVKANGVWKPVVPSLNKSGIWK
jgi:hypothetical protein